MKSVMKHQFSQVPQANIPRSIFNRSCGHKTTFDAGLLIPIFLDEALPGDTFNLRASMFARMATPIYPIMDNLTMSVFWFAVPMRLIWNNWEKFCGAQTDPDDSTSFLTPQIVAPAVTGFTVGTLSDYFGLPTGVASLPVNSFWHRAYNLIWNEHFRDQNIQDSVVVDKDDGPDDIADYVLLRRGKRHDYFTSALPWPQKGVAVDLPLGTSAPVLGLGIAQIGSTASVNVYESGQTADSTWTGWWMEGASASSGAPGEVKVGIRQGSGNIPNVYADLKAATAATINSLREAFQLQRLLERDARSGTRYTEKIKAHFGVTSPDARLQRPEILGLSRGDVRVLPVVQTSATGATGTPMGQVSGYGVIQLQGAGFTKSFTEHCVILGLMCVDADLNYQQGLPRMFSRRTQYDFYWPGLANLGEQAVYNKEIYCDGSANDTLVFGYQERWAEYRYKSSQITGLFRSTYATPLDAWHLAEEFGSLPTLSPTFIESNPPMDRVKAVSTEPDFIFDSVFDVRCARPMPVYSVPGLIDHL